MSTPELSRSIRLDTLGEGERLIEIEATPLECEALATRFELLDLPKLSARAVIMRAGDVVEAEGRLTAKVVQACVATGADVPATIDELFKLRFVPLREAGAEMELDEGDLDEITYTGSSIDLGEAVAQTLGLSLDLFPRAPEAEQTLKAAGVISEEEAGPFSALKGLRDLLKE